jgi:V/A-type H+/Na+-transporting ATPase subunit F
MTFFCIADKESALGFKLAGIQTRQVSNRQDALEALSLARSGKDVGIILITEQAASFVQEEISQQITNNPIPLVLEIPSRGAIKPRKSAGELLKQLVGIGI